MDTKELRLGVIGLGNMASAIVDGFLYTGALRAENIFACARDPEKLRRNAERRGIRACGSAEEVVDAADVVLVAVLPGQVEAVVRPLADRFGSRLVVSIAADVLCEKWNRWVPETVSHISTIPNTPVSICEGILVCEETHSLTEEQLSAFKRIFSSIGVLEFIDSKHLSVGGTVAGCGPAFAAMFIEALGDAGVKYGLRRETAYRLAAQVLAGTGARQQVSGAHPGAMKDAVCSPGGTTIRGVGALEEAGFRNALIKAIDAIEG